jgi:hypothetical protein
MLRGVHVLNPFSTQSWLLVAATRVKYVAESAGDLAVRSPVHVPSGLDAVAEKAKKITEKASDEPGSTARSTLLADDNHHQKHRYKVQAPCQPL